MEGEDNPWIAIQGGFGPLRRMVDGFFQNYGKQRFRVGGKRG
jgi:hypothetical protein